MFSRSPLRHFALPLLSLNMEKKKSNCKQKPKYILIFSSGSLELYRLHGRRNYCPIRKYLPQAWKPRIKFKVRKKNHNIKWKNVFWVKPGCSHIDSTLSLVEQISSEVCKAHGYFCDCRLLFLQIDSSKEGWRLYFQMFVIM